MLVPLPIQLLVKLASQVSLLTRQSFRIQAELFEFLFEAGEALLVGFVFD